MKAAFQIQYKGTDFFGSQIQKQTPNTVMGVVSHIFSKLGIKGTIAPSGRTDKGVHATGQVCHIELPPFWDDIKKLKKVLNKMLPPSIKIKKIWRVDDNFHARYSAKKRVYRYIIKQGESNPFEDDFVTFVQNIDFEKTIQNTKLFEGKHNFKNFIKNDHSSKTTIREIYKSFAYKHNGYIVLYFEANGFLRTQIRFMVYAILNMTKDEILQQLYLKKKHKLKPAPPNGLYLAKIKYV